MSTRPSRYFIALLALGFVLGAGGAVLAQAQVTADDLNQLTWRWVGPVNFSGRIAEFAVPPGQTAVYYVLTASGGLWKTEDAGTHFEPIFDKYGNMSMGSLGIAASDPKVLYLGTGEPMHARSSSRGNGVWKSTDAGKTWTKVGLENSYFINKVQVDPKNPDVVYVAAEGKLYDNAMDSERGFYKTADGGKTWERLWPLDDRGVGDFVVDPRDFNVVIAQAYKTYRRSWTFIDRQPGNHLYKTTDGGKTWKKLVEGLPVGADFGRAGLGIFLKNPNIVYARLDEEVNLGLAERDGAANFRAAGGFGGGGFGGGGLFAETYTFDKFKAFKINPEMAKQAPKFTPITAADEAELVKKLNELVADKDFLTKSGVDLAKLDAAARKAYAGKKEIVAAIDEIEALQKREAPKADSSEAKGRSQVVNRHVLEMLYAGVLRNQAPVKRSGVVYRSDDLGETWKKMTEYKHVGGSALVNQTEAGYYARLYVDGQNDQTVYCVDTNTTVSTDGGKTFKTTGWDQGAFKLHVDHRALWVDPQNPNHIMSANDGGAGETWDGGKHWSQKATVSAQQFYDIAADNEQPYNVMGGTQDNGAWIGPSQNRNNNGVYAADWNYLPTGDGFYVVRDWWNPEYIYYESQFGSSSRQNLKTGEISQLAKRTTPEELAKGMPAQRYQWNAPIVLSPHNPGIVYICSQFVHRSLSRGDRDTFVTISPDLSRADKTRLEESKKTNLQYATIYTFAESAKKPGLFWAGTDDGNVQMSPDNGATWTNITANFYDMKTGKPKPGVKGALIPFDRWVKRVVPSRYDENTCYVGFSGYRTHNEDKTWLFVTRDLGKTWEDISGGLANPIFDVEEDPDNPDVLYISGDYGIHVSIDKGKSWTPFSTSAPNVIVRDMAIQKRDRDLVIGTYGRGIYIADIAPLKELKADILAKDAHLFDIEEAVRWNRLERRGESYGEFAKVSNPAIGTTIYYYLKAEPKSVKLIVKDLEGTLVQELAGNAKKGLQKADWNLARRVDPAQQAAGARPAGGMRGRGANLVDYGAYKVTLNVDGKDIATKTVKVSPDPLFK
ncbi:MAG: hypothetical protein A2V57_02070 [Candidatus Aminicenantes bacterium RBG_19FT_COMBO_65_30]|nr:MAG: hypothetical protein A2V57_02070 [Candidatus Aminicenantes bacterium RBG_19FT_COMBO_65_30]